MMTARVVLFLAFQTARTFVVGVTGFLFLLSLFVGIPSFFGCCRIPESPKDASIVYLTSAQFIRLVVCCAGMSYSLCHGLGSFASKISALGMLLWPLGLQFDFLFHSLWFLFVVNLFYIARTILNLRNTGFHSVFIHLRVVFRLCFVASCFGAICFGGLICTAFVDVEHVVQYIHSPLVKVIFNDAKWLLFYGGYFGVLHKDVCLWIHDQVRVQLRTPDIRKQIGNCGLCGDVLDHPNEEGILQSHKSIHFMLECRHEFHETCLRGWALFGKRHTCPVCGEKTERVEELNKSAPWDQVSQEWVYFLNAMRLLCLFVPALLLLGRSLVYFITKTYYTAKFNEVTIL